jgi:hypothetical protein
MPNTLFTRTQTFASLLFIQHKVLPSLGEDPQKSQNQDLKFKSLMFSKKKKKIQIVEKQVTDQLLFRIIIIGSDSISYTFFFGLSFL